MLFQTVSRSRVASLSRLTYKRIASHVHIKTAVNPRTDINRKLRCELQFSMVANQDACKKACSPSIPASFQRVSCRSGLRSCRPCKALLRLSCPFRPHTGCWPWPWWSVCLPSCATKVVSKLNSSQRSRKKTSCHGSRKLYVQANQNMSTWILDI